MPASEQQRLAIPVLPVVDPWRVVCPACGAQPGEGCTARSGMRCGDHGLRLVLAGFKPLPAR